MMRLAREDKSMLHHDIPSGNLMRSLLVTGRCCLDSIGGGNLVRAESYADRGHLLDSLDRGEVLRMLDAVSGGDLLSSVESSEGESGNNGLKKTRTKHPKRMLDSVSGWAFGESKRNFDEIDNVGFTGFAKKSPSPYRNRNSLALAKKNFDEIDRAGFETYNKRNFDEIDRTGFETFEKRDRKE